MDAIHIILLCFFTLLWSNTAQAIVKIQPNNIGYWIVDGYQISLDIRCDISRSGFVPEKYCTQPSVVIERHHDSKQDSPSFNTLYFKLVAGRVELGDKWMFDGNNDPQRRVPLSDITFGKIRSEELFRLLMSDGDSLPIKFMTRSGEDAPIKSRIIELSGFKSYADEQIKEINYQYSKKEGDAKRDLIFALVLLAVFCGMTFMLARFLIKKTRRKIHDVKQHIETKRVSRVAEDEAIREIVRQSVQQVDGQSIEVLRNQIKSALDAGDTKTAEELLKIMNGLTQK